jgi:hypothetical protein
MAHYRNWTQDDDYDSDDEYNSESENYVPRRPPRELTEAEFVDENFDEISAMYSSLVDYMQTYGPCLLQTLTFDAFATFVYQNSYR